MTPGQLQASVASRKYSGWASWVKERRSKSSNIQYQWNPMPEQEGELDSGRKEVCQARKVRDREEGEE